MAIDSPLKRKIAKVWLVYWISKRHRTKSKRKEWVNAMWLKRNTKGQFSQLIPDLLTNPNYSLQDYLRVDEVVFQMLINGIRGRLQKHCRNRIPISPEEQLTVTLSFLASGLAYKRLAFYYRIHPSTISLFVPNVCRAIIDVFQPEFLATPSTPNEWIHLAKRFNERWQFPNCIGALDGKHVYIQAPSHTGSDFFNYKRCFSLILMAAVDADYRFVYVDIGMQGRISDAGVWQHCSLRQALESQQLGIPPVYNGTPLVFVADEIFPLTVNIMKPFARRGLSQDQLIFNYRQSRARRNVENAFGILAMRFRLLTHKILIQPQKACLAVYACCVLHNILRDSLTTQNSYLFNHIDREDIHTGQVIGGTWRNEPGSGLRGITTGRQFNRSSADAMYLRNLYKEYFSSPQGAVPWQNRAIGR